MPDTIIKAGLFKPSNLILPPEMAHLQVDGDLYDICARVQQVDPKLRVVPLVEDPDGYAFAVVEHCHDGVERLVFKVKELDGRVIQHLRKLMSMSLAERLVQIEKDEHRLAAQEKERQLDDLYERIGRPMWTDLEKCGFIQRPTSYPKKGIKATKD